MNQELTDAQAVFTKGRGTRSNCQHLLIHREKARQFQKKKICFCFIDYAKAFDCLDHRKVWKILKDMGITDHITYLLRNLYASQKTTVKTLLRITYWFKIEKGVYQGCILSPAYLIYM